MIFLTRLLFVTVFISSVTFSFAQDQSIKDLEFLIGTWEVREDNDKKTWWEKATRIGTYTLDSTHIQLQAQAHSSSGKQRTYLWLIHYNDKDQQFEMVSMFSNWPKTQLDILTWNADDRTLTIVHNPQLEEFPQRFGQLVFSDDYQSYEWRGENKYGDPDEPSIWKYLEVGQKIE